MHPRLRKLAVIPMVSVVAALAGCTAASGLENLYQTKDNLKALGYTNYAGISFRPNPDPNKSAVPFKSGARREIAAQGYTIIANIGDQQSDLDGGFAERTFKLPNPFYFSP